MYWERPPRSHPVHGTAVPWQAVNPAPLIETAFAGHVTDDHAMPGLIPLLAHQGGWDEALLVGLPLALIGLLLWVANRRVSAQLRAAVSENDRSTDTNPSVDHPDTP